MTFRGLGRTKNWKKQLSEASDERKIGKNDFPTPWMNKKLKKWLSNPLDEQKIGKNGFPTPWKWKNRCLN